MIGRAPGQPGRNGHADDRGALDIFYGDVCSHLFCRCAAHARSFLWSVTFGTMSLARRTKTACVTTGATDLAVLSDWFMSLRDLSYSKISSRLENN